MSFRWVVVRPSLVALSLGLLCAAACAAPDTPAVGDGDGDGDQDPGKDPDSGDGDDGSDVPIIDPGTSGGVPVTSECGDGERGEDEACDDGNGDDGDGCPSDCGSIEGGFICPTQGEPCRPFSKCGDGVVVPPEQCDDGATASKDGCSAICQVEIGWKCSVADDGTDTACEETECGDGKKEGAETCDDGNTLPFDGCSPLCQAEPQCSGTSGCTSSCGDGVLVGAEECDDGNLIEGDGCSSNCDVEDGYECELPKECDEVNGECVLSLPIVYRDFSKGHADFGVDCGNGTGLLGLAQATLTAGKPTLVGQSNGEACVQSATSFAQWYSDVPEVNATVADHIVLFETEAGSGVFSNRLNNEGERYMMPSSEGLQWCSNNAGECDKCAPGYSKCYETCTPWGNTQTCAEYAPDNPVYLDGNPLFFPIDGRGLSNADAEAETANIPQEVYGGGWKAEPGGAKHNFHFTSEIAYWFNYDEGSTMNLTFVGDDDVWVYVNGRLAVDLGGLHVPVEGSFNIGANGTVTTVSSDAEPETSDVADFGLEAGKVYEIKVFQAERKVTGSSYKLTLSGFNAARSLCMGTCGDGILTAGEMCDDGEDNSPQGSSTHNRCAYDCTLGSYCGDGIKQDEEICDDNDYSDPRNADCAGCAYVRLH